MDTQDAMWGEDRELNNETWLTILAEEVGECAEASLKEQEEHLRDEVIQVVAVGLQWLENIDRRKLKHPREEK
jgi:NTP pyrophosphatase (non-canonical NTP hydrolase)